MMATKNEAQSVGPGVTKLTGKDHNYCQILTKINTLTMAATWCNRMNRNVSKQQINLINSTYNPVRKKIS